MKTVAEVAEDLGVSKMAVYRRINTTLEQEMEPHVVKMEGATHILPEGVAVLRKDLDSGRDKHPEEEEAGEVSPETETVQERLNRLEEEYINTLKEELRRKNEQLEKKDDLLQNFQVILRQNQERMQALEGERRGRSFWDRLFWWRR